MELQLPNFVVHQCEEIASCRCQNPIANFGCPPLSPWNQPKKGAKEEWWRMIIIRIYIYTVYIYMYIYIYVKWRNLFVMFFSLVHGPCRGLRHGSYGGRYGIAISCGTCGTWGMGALNSWNLSTDELLMWVTVWIKHFCGREWVESGSWWKMVHVLKFMES